MYGCSQSLVGLQKQFFQRYQLEGESLREYSHALMALMEAMKRKNLPGICNPDHTLRDQFIEHMRDNTLRRELKRQVRLNTEMSFLEVRSEAIWWAEEGETPCVRPRAHSCAADVQIMGMYRSNPLSPESTNELGELKDCLHKQQAQLDAILKHLSISSTNTVGGVGSRPGAPRFQSDVKQAGKEWKQALLECQSLALTAESGLLGKAVVRAGSAIRVPVGSLQWVPATGCQEQGVVHVPVVNLGEKDQWLRPKTFLGQLYRVALQSVLDTELEKRMVSQGIVNCNQVVEGGSEQLSDPFEVSWPSLSAAQSRQAKCLLSRFSFVFSKSEGDLGCTHLVQHEIPVLDNAPVRQRYRQLPPSQYEQVKTHIAPLHRLVGELQGKGKKRCSGTNTLLEGRWTEVLENAFVALKRSLVEAPVLGYADFSKPFVLEIDASQVGLGAVLSQEQEGQRRPIAYASRGLRPAERNMSNYSSMKLELLALKWAISEKFREYLLGAKFVVFIDNNPLSYLQTAKLAAVEQRWVFELALFDFELKYHPGIANRNADALSRLPIDPAPNSVEEVGAGITLPQALSLVPQAQVYLLHTYAIIEFTILSVMCYDRYVAICHPLQYHSIMTITKVYKLIAFSWGYPLVTFALFFIMTLRLTICQNRL
ncbi:hypothetical protein QQF64_017712, partial [Cirrhinus molitorella]